MASGWNTEGRDNNLVLDRVARRIRRAVEETMNLSGRGDKDVAQAAAMEKLEMPE